MPAYIFPQQEQVAHQIRTALHVFVESEAATRPHFHRLARAAQASPICSRPWPKNWVCL